MAHQQLPDTRATPLAGPATATGAPGPAGAPAGLPVPRPASAAAARGALPVPGGGGLTPGPGGTDTPGGGRRPGPDPVGLLPGDTARGPALLPGRADGADAAHRTVRTGAADGSAGDLLGGYLRGQATRFLRGLGMRGGDDGEGDALVRGCARRIGAVLHTYGELTDTGWAEPLRAELGWATATLGREPQYARRLARLLEALRRLSAAEEAEPALGAARAAALLERQLTLARTRAHSATLQAVGSSRFHALADAIAVLASDVPLTAAAAGPAGTVLAPLAAQAHQRLADAVAALPLQRAAHPYNAEAVQAALGAEPANDAQDAPWHQVRALLRLSRYAAEVAVAGPADPADPQRLDEAARLLRRHREAAESAAAVAAAARTPRIAPATAYALGVLHADQRHEVEAVRFAFARLWHRE